MSELDLEEIVILPRDQVGKGSWGRGNSMYMNMEKWNSIVCLGKHEWFVIAGGLRPRHEEQWEMRPMS